MKRQEIEHISIPQIRKYMCVESDGFGDEILVFSDRKIYSELYNQPLRVDAFTISFCMAGEAEMVVYDKEYHMNSGSICIQTPGTPAVWNHVSEDYQGFEVVLSMEFLKNLPFDLKNITAAFAYLKHESCFRLSEKQQQDFFHIFHLTAGLSVHMDYYKRQSLQGIVVSLLYLICDLIHQSEQDFSAKMNARNNGDRRHYYLLNFLELLGKYSHQERSISFYADKMFLTPKYLSTIIKEVSGKSAGEWIDEYVMMEAKALLQHSETNVSETAYQLNFPNASFFGRFFKKHTGMSPGDFKRKYAFQA